MPELLPEEIAASVLAGTGETAGAGMSLSDIAGLGAGANAVSGLLGANAARQAGALQAGAADRATQAQLQMFNTLNQQGAGYRQTGGNALNALATGLGIGGTGTGGGTAGSPNDPAVALYNRDLMATRGYPLQPEEMSQPEVQAQLASIRSQDQTEMAGIGTSLGQFTHQFNASDLNANLAPNWQFALQQGQGAAANALNATGGMGGNYGRGLVDYTLNRSGDLYQQAYQNYNANQTNIFNRLSNVAGLGSTANQQSVSAGTGLAPGIASTTVGQGAAQAAGLVGSTNALTGGMQNAASWYALPTLLNAGRSNA